MIFMIAISLIATGAFVVTGLLTHDHFWLFLALPYFAYAISLYVLRVRSDRAAKKEREK